jgi:hypothetical protein
MKPQKKVKPKISKKAGVKKSLVTKSLNRHENSWVAIGFDTSLSSLAGAAIGYDAILGKLMGPAFVMRRWTKDDHYFDRITMCAKAHELVLDLLAELRMIVPNDRVWIAQEEPFPPHSKFMGRKGGGGQAMKQQAEISGAFLGGLLRYGFSNLWQIGSDKWRGVIRDQLIEDGKEAPDFTLYHAKWKSATLAQRYNCKYEDSGKFRAKQWAQDVYEPWSYQEQGIEIPDWPDIIKANSGNIPRPETSKAKGFQPDDRYDALAMMEFMRLELISLGVVK